MEKTVAPVEKAHRLLSPRVAYLVSTVSSDDRPNVAAISYLIPVSEEPEAVMLSITDDTRTYANLRATRQFVVNIAAINLVDSIWICGGNFSLDAGVTQQDKFELASLTTIPSIVVKPPRIEECYAHIECKVQRIQRYGDHHLVVGIVVAASHSLGAFDNKQLLSPDMMPAMQLTGPHFVSLGARRQPGETRVRSDKHNSQISIQSDASVELVKE